MPLRIQTLWREPLLHFVLIGAALFLYYDFVGRGDSEAPARKRIMVSSGQVEQLVANFERTWSRPPTPQERDVLVESHVREEVFYREALAMGLDRDDAIIRRRLRQKLEFLTDDVAELEPPGDAELQAFLDENPDTFTQEAEVAFQQVYVSDDRHGQQAAARAEAVLGVLRAGQAPGDLGASLILPDAMPLSREGEVARLFGARFARALLEQGPGGWAGPVRSEYGLHLVRVTELVPPRLPALAEIRDQVEREWLVRHKKEVQDRLYQGLRERYIVVVEEPAPVRKTELAAKAAGVTSETVQ